MNDTIVDESAPHITLPKRTGYKYEDLPEDFRKWHEEGSNLGKNTTIFVQRADGLWYNKAEEPHDVAFKPPLYM